MSSENNQLEPLLRLITDFDVAHLLGQQLNAIHVETNPDRRAEGLLWWEGALAEDIESTVKQERLLRATPAYMTRLRAFSRANLRRAVPLSYLGRAITQGSRQGYGRWRWAGRSYARAVVAFVEQEALRSSVRGALRRYHGLAEEARPHAPELAHLAEAWRTVATSEHVDRASHGLARQLDVERRVHKLARHRDEKRTRLRSLAREVEEKLGAAVVQEAKRERTINRQIVAMQRALVGAAAVVTGNSVTEQAEAFWRTVGTTLGAFEKQAGLYGLLDALDE